MVVLPLLAAAHTAVWAAGLATLPFAWSPRAAIAQYFSTLVLVIASTNLILATRTRVLERPYGGLDKMFASHRVDGVTAGSLLVAHVAIIPITTRLIPGRLLGILVFLLIEGSVVLAIAPRAPWHNLLYVRYQTWKAEHRFMGIFVLLAVTHSLLVPAMIRAMPLVRVWVYGWAAIGLLAYTYRETVFRVWARRHAYTVAHASPLGGRIFEVHLAPERAPIAHKAGQFAFVSFRDGPTRERHPFTISAPPQGGALRFSIRALGDYTVVLPKHLPQGSSANIEGPYGCFDFTAGRPRQLWVAGGVGITPYLAFLPTVDPAREVTLVWSVHDEKEAVYREELENAARDKPHVRVIVWPSADKGRLTMSNLGIERPEELSVYLCGPVKMRDAFAAQLEGMGVARRDMYWEEFSLR